MKITKWVDMGAEVEIQIGADDIRGALNEAFSCADQRLDEAVNIHDVLRALNGIASFLMGISDENIARLTDKQRELIGGFLRDQAPRYLAAGPAAEAQGDESGAKA